MIVQGGVFFTDFKGSAENLLGGVYYVSADYRHISPIVSNLAIANGVALSTDERKLWITEMANNRLHCIELNEDRISIQNYGTSVPYHFIGTQGPDSCCIDSGDNLYVAMYKQGRVMVFNRNGFPIGQVLLPGRTNGSMLNSTHSTLRPNSNDLIICSNDGTNGQGSWLFKAGAFDNAHNSFQFK